MELPSSWKCFFFLRINCKFYNLWMSRQKCLCTQQNDQITGMENRTSITNLFNTETDPAERQRVPNHMHNNWMDKFTRFEWIFG